MSRLLTLVVPISLVVSACSSPPSQPSSVAEAGLSMHELRVSPESAAVSASEAWTPGASEGSSTELIASEPGAAAPAENTVFAGMTDRHFTVLGGERWLTDRDWDPVHDQPALGLEIDGSDPETGHGYEFGVTYSQGDGSVGPRDITGKTIDIYGGYRHTFRTEEPELHPYLSAGLAMIRGEVEVDGPNNDDDDHSAGAYLRAGISYDVQPDVRLGLDYRHMFMTDHMNLGAIGDANFDQVMLTLGFGF